MNTTSQLKSLQSVAAVVTGVVCAIAASPAHAHGEKGQSKSSTAIVKKDQKEWGIAGDRRAARRTIAVSMGDNMRFTPDLINVKLGETVRFTVRNGGKAMHEFVIGTRKVLDEHATLMVRFPDMEHDEPHMAHVPPGQTGEIVWTFNRAGEFDFACLIAGHYAAGMKGRITVAAK